MDYKEHVVFECRPLNTDFGNNAKNYCDIERHIKAE